MSEGTIFHNDDYKIFDKLADKMNKKPRLGVLGWVQVFFDNQQQHEGGNLVVSQGREFVAQKIFDIVNYEGGNRPDYRNYKISHFAIGSGGAIASGKNVTLMGPYICDKSLNEPITLGNTGFLEEPSNYDNGDGVNSYIDSVKPIVTDGSINLETEEYVGNDVTCNNFTRIKCVCKIPAGEPSGIMPGESVQVSEAGLYFTNTDGNVKMFSHICFPPKWKEKESDLTINWYILC